MIKRTLHYTNPGKRVITRLAGRNSIVEVFDGMNAVDNAARFKYAIAYTDDNGNALADDGIILTADELAELAGRVPDLISSGVIQATRTIKEYRAIYPEQERPQKPRLF